MTMNAGELLANSLSAGKVVCLLVRPWRGGRAVLPRHRHPLQVSLNSNSH